MPTNNIFLTDRQTIWSRSVKTFLLNYVAKYPLDQYRSFRINNTLRNDHTFLRNSERFVLIVLVKISRVWVHAWICLWWCFTTGVNLKQGLQLKSFSKLTSVLFRHQWWNQHIRASGLVIDCRIRRQISSSLYWSILSFANRFYLNSSFGSQRLLNQLEVRRTGFFCRNTTMSNLPILIRIIVFHKLQQRFVDILLESVTGSSAMLLNSELHSIFQYLLNQNWRNSFFRNLQLVTFLILVLPEWLFAKTGRCWKISVLRFKSCGHCQRSLFRVILLLPAQGLA